jgi:hypothetical protein
MCLIVVSYQRFFLWGFFFAFKIYIPFCMRLKKSPRCQPTTNDKGGATDKQFKSETTVRGRNWADILLNAVGHASEGGSGRQSSKGVICNKHGELDSISLFELFSRYASRWFPTRNILASCALFQFDRRRVS